ncbi:MAG: response regulator transcription factor [Chitinophagaceae bacterium]|nr:response regulator transcription factor [Chitinophagaceae bacterium]
MNIVIIEDELMTAEDLVNIIDDLDKDISISAVLHSVEDSIKYFLKNPLVDLVFSDIQLGDGLSFEIFKTVQVDAPIIFCTAYDEYALEAIRNNGIDYILKPFTGTSVIKAIDKYNKLKRYFVPTVSDFDKLIHAITGDASMGNEYSSILVYYKDKVVPVKFTDIALIYIDGEVNRVYCFNGKTYVISQALDELEQMTRGHFFRVNRQYLVNKLSIIDATHYFPRKYVLNLSIPFKEAIVVSKNRTSGFLQWLTQK